MSLTLLCVTRGEARALPFLSELSQLGHDLNCEVVIGADRCSLSIDEPNQRVVPLTGRDCVEEILNEAIDACTGDYILRLDDDESVSAGMYRWLFARAYEQGEAWFFHRYALWPDTDHLVVSPPFFPDFQQRLTIRAKAKRPPTVHAGSPWPGYQAPVAIRHHAFIVKTYAERQAITAHYESLIRGRVFKPEEANVVAPEDWKGLVIEPVDENALRLRAQEFVYWRAVGVPVPANLEAQLNEWRAKENL